MPNGNFEERVLDKLDSLEEGQKKIELTIAQLPHLYVPRKELHATHREAVRAKRWAIGAAASWFGALISFTVLVLNIL